MAPTRKTESRVEWLERRITRRSALKTGAAGTAVAAAALWVSPAVRTVHAAHTGGHLGTLPPVVCERVWEDFEGHATGAKITSLANIPSVYTRRPGGGTWTLIEWQTRSRRSLASWPFVAVPGSTRATRDARLLMRDLTSGRACPVCFQTIADVQSVTE